MSEISSTPPIPPVVHSPTAEKPAEGSATKSADRQAVQAAPEVKKPEGEERPVISQEQVEQAVSQLNEYLKTTQRELHFSLDKDSGQTVVKVLDTNTQEVVRQIPEEVVLKLASQLGNQDPLHLFRALA